MPHFKCVPCRLRLSKPSGLDDHFGELCTGCGSPLELVGDLSELVGFRAIKDPAASLTGHQRLAARVREVREEADEAEAAFDAGRWLDDGGSFSPGAVAQAAAMPRPEWTR